MPREIAIAPTSAATTVLASASRSAGAVSPGRVAATPASAVPRTHRQAAADGLALARGLAGRGHQRAALGHVVAHLAAQVAVQVGRERALRGRARQSGPRALHDLRVAGLEGMREGLGREVLLVGEMLVQRAVREPGLAAHVGHAHAVDAVLLEQLARGFEQGQLVLLRLFPGHFHRLPLR
ncbi:MAG: hypothetical protein QM777_21650 [Pseudorhodoferax sp.]